MYKVETARKVVAVWVFTAYDDGSIDVTQTAPDKGAFVAVRKGIAAMQRWCAKAMKDQDKCPFSPANPVVVEDKNVSPMDELL